MIYSWDSDRGISPTFSSAFCGSIDIDFDFSAGDIFKNSFFLCNKFDWLKKNIQKKKLVSEICNSFFNNSKNSNKFIVYLC